MFSIRTTDINDRYLINKLAAQVWENTYGKILSKEQLDYMFEMMYAPENILRQMTGQGHQYLIASVDGAPSGYISLERQDEDAFILQKIYALPQAQGTGLGRYMVEQVVSHLKSIHPNSPFTILLYVNRENPAVGFYKHLGFYEHSTRDHHIGNGYYMNDYIMAMEVGT